MSWGYSLPPSAYQTNCPVTGVPSLQQRRQHTSWGHEEWSRNFHPHITHTQTNVQREQWRQLRACWWTVPGPMEHLMETKSTVPCSYTWTHPSSRSMCHLLKFCVTGKRFLPSHTKPCRFAHKIAPDAGGEGGSTHQTIWGWNHETVGTYKIPDTPCGGDGRHVTKPGWTTRPGEKWDRSGIILEALWYDRYHIKVAGRQSAIDSS